ncbi:MAG: acetyl-CoA C-acetyltransferase, partial [Conexibacteraceae bacterium]|nr:acetyl-CoA C-acetyltransferase [Conexibacteraceae bacterium]
MRDAVICEPLRTPVGGFGGVFRDVPVTTLAATVIRELISRTGLPPEQVDDVILGQGYPNGDAPALGRVAALDAGLPDSVPGIQVDRRCGSGLQAVIDACLHVQTGAADVVLAGGADSMSQVELYSAELRWGVKTGGVTLKDRLQAARTRAGGEFHPVPGGMIETAENLRRQYSIAREEQDELALRSHRFAVRAHEHGVFAEEIVPVELPGRRGAPPTSVDRDEHPRPDTSLEKLAALRPIMLSADPDATVTAGNTSGQNDGAAICIVTHPERAAALGLRPFARLVSWAVAGVAPETMGIGPVPAVARAFARAGLGFADMSLIELNEAFAAQVLAVLREWQLPDGMERVNVNGSGIALGHPIGATGGRILT